MGAVLNEALVVLVVEDEDALQEFAEDALTDGGFGSAVVSSAEEALNLFKGRIGDYVALLTDINLKGGMSGWQLAREVREVAPSFPVVYMTGSDAEHWTSRGVPNSILLAKPFAPAQLVTALSNLLNTGSPPTA